MYIYIYICVCVSVCYTVSHIRISTDSLHASGCKRSLLVSYHDEPRPSHSKWNPSSMPSRRKGLVCMSPIPRHAWSELRLPSSGKLSKEVSESEDSDWQLWNVGARMPQAGAPRLSRGNNAQAAKWSQCLPYIALQHLIAFAWVCLLPFICHDYQRNIWRNGNPSSAVARTIKNCASWANAAKIKAKTRRAAGWSTAYICIWM